VLFPSLTSHRCVASRRRLLSFPQYGNHSRSRVAVRQRRLPLRTSITVVIVPNTNDYEDEPTVQARRQQGAPPLVLVGSLVLVFFLAGVIASAALGALPPDPLSEAAAVATY
jgi:hypothetical protein